MHFPSKHADQPVQDTPYRDRAQERRLGISSGNNIDEPIIAAIGLK